MMKRIFKAAAGAIAASVLATAASAHATSIGYANAGPGQVAIWLGTYLHGGHHLEGSMNLVGVNGNPFASTTVPFTLAAGADGGSGAAWTGLPGYQGASKPAGLVDGVTNFYAPNGCTIGSDPLTATPNTCGGGVDHWQGAVFAGLTPGDYQFTWTPIANPTAEWSVLNSNMNGIFTIRGVIINPGAVPLPAGLPLMAGAFGLIAALRLRKKKA